jgi:hypothetical protein
MLLGVSSPASHKQPRTCCLALPSRLLGYSNFASDVHAGSSDSEVCVNLPTVSGRHAVIEIGGQGGLIHAAWNSTKAMLI